MAKITVTLADDHEIMRHGLRALLEREPDMDVVGEGSTGIEALQLVERLHPTVAILDMQMPGLSGLDVAREVHTKFPATRTVILSMHGEEEYVTSALRHGALGYVLKGNSAQDLVSAVRAAAEGRRFLSADLSERAYQVYVARAQQVSPVDVYDTLTTREREVLTLVAEGKTSAEIAALLHLSTRTVETYRRQLMSKLELGNQADLIKYAIKRGLVEM